MKTTRIISLVLALFMVVCVFASCGKAAISENAVKVTVSFEADGKEFYSKEVTVNDDEPTVLMAVQNIMDENDDITITLDSDDEPTTIQDIVCGSDSYMEADGGYWEFKINDNDYKDTTGRACNNKIKDGDVITWQYNED